MAPSAAPPAPHLLGHLSLFALSSVSLSRVLSQYPYFSPQTPPYGWVYLESPTKRERDGQRSIFARIWHLYPWLRRGAIEKRRRRSEEQRLLPICLQVLLIWRGQEDRVSRILLL